jgi:hypothetical protein
MSGFYHIKVSSLPDYEQLVAEIYVNDQFVALVSQEMGPDQTQLELTAVEGPPIRMDIVTFENALAEAKRRLSDLGKSRWRSP